MASRALFPEDTYTVSQLGAEVQSFLSEAYRSVWVVGEVQRLRGGGSHLYFELVEKGRGDSITAKLDVVLFRADRARAERQLRTSGLELEEGQVLRCRGQVDFYAPFGRLQFVARDVDPVFGLGVLEQRRQETLRWLAQRELLERNGSLELSELPLRLGLVTAPGSAAYHDFIHTLEQSGYGFEVLFAPSAVQGAAAPRALVRSLGMLAEHHERIASLDALVIVRGGGSKTDLAAFDDRAVAESVATAPVPVVTGIGHEVDESIADRVAHTSVKTPTGAAELFCARVAASERRWQSLAAGVVSIGRERVRRERDRLDRARSGARAVAVRLTLAGRLLDERAAVLAASSRTRVTGARRRLAEVGGAVPRHSQRVLTRREKERSAVAERVIASTARMLTRATESIDPLARLVAELSPERVLERGYSLTRDTHGRVVRDAARLGAGEVIDTQLARGRVRSRVETTETEE